MSFQAAAATSLSERFFRSVAHFRRYGCQTPPLSLGSLACFSATTNFVKQVRRDHHAPPRDNPTDTQSQHARDVLDDLLSEDRST